MLKYRVEIRYTLLNDTTRDTARVTCKAITGQMLQARPAFQSAKRGTIYMDDVQVREKSGKRWMLWAGRLLSLWPAIIVVSSATWKLSRSPWYVAEFGRIGWPESALTGLALLQLGCLVLYLIPPTAVMGTVLLTGYLGGAIAAYVRIGEPYPVLVPLATSLIAWAGIYLREERLRALLPLRRRVVRS